MSWSCKYCSTPNDDKRTRCQSCLHERLYTHGEVSSMIKQAIVRHDLQQGKPTDQKSIEAARTSEMYPSNWLEKLGNLFQKKITKKSKPDPEKPHYQYSLYAELPESDWLVWWYGLGEAWQNVFYDALQFKGLPTERRFAQIDTLTEINCANRTIDNLNPLSRLNSVMRVFCQNTSIHDLSPLMHLTHLKELDCSNTEVCDLGPISHLDQLEVLQFNDTGVRNLLPLKNFTHLITLSMDKTGVADLSPIQSLHQLQLLSCNHTVITNLSPLKNLQNLQFFYACDAPIEDLSPLESAKNLKIVECKNTSLTKEAKNEFIQRHPESKVIYY